MDMGFNEDIRSRVASAQEIFALLCKNTYKIQLDFLDYHFFVDSMIFQEDEADSTQCRIELLHLRAAAQILRAREDVTEINNWNSFNFRCCLCHCDGHFMVSLVPTLLRTWSGYMKRRECQIADTDL